MSSFTWTSGVSGDWSIASNWSTGTVPNDPAAVVYLSAAPVSGGSYTVTIGAGETQSVSSVLLSQLGGTLAVNGTLDFTATGNDIAFLGGNLAVGSTGVIEGNALIGDLIGVGAPDSFVNDGTLIANAGSALAMEILIGLTNNGTLLANNGVLHVDSVNGTTGFTNLQGGTLTGGSYVVQGTVAPGATSYTDNLLEFGGYSTAVITVDAANIVLDGIATDIYGYAGSFQPIEQQLQTIASNGTLQLLGNRGYSTTNLLTDNGQLIFQGGSLVTGGLNIGATGTVAGYGIVTSRVSNAGTVIANGGSGHALDIVGAVSGSGSLAVTSGSSMILQGGTAAGLAVANGGTLFDTGSLHISGAALGSGMVVVEAGGALQIDGGASLGIDFAGTNIAVTLGAPALYTGTIAGFGLGDSLTLDGIQANGATIVNGNTLAVLANSTTLDTITLSGNYSGASFIATTLGNNTLIQNVSGAPARDNMPITLVNFVDNAGLTTTQEQQIQLDLQAAAANWGQYITGAAPLRVSLTIANSGGSGGELATGSPGSYVPTGQTIDGHPLYEANSIYALTTGNYASGTSVDVAITLIASPTNLANFYINPDPSAGTAVPIGKYDLISVLTHEFGHGLGIDGLIDRFSPAAASPPVQSGAAITTYDEYVQAVLNGATLTAADFTGSYAEAAYGTQLGTVATPVPLTLITNDAENFYHFANSTSDPLGKDLMSGIGLDSGTAVAISAVDLGVLADIGVPVTAGLVCYARGTRIATPDGEIPIEQLRVGQHVLTAGGEAVPIVWIGRRHVDCCQHPRPDQVQPIRIRAHAFGPGLPRRDLLVSPKHGIYFDGVLIPARMLLNDETITRCDCNSVDYYHVELPQHDLLLAEGLAAESYLDCGDRCNFANGGGVVRLHADFSARIWEAAGCAELHVIGPAVEAARQHLATRAVAVLQPIGTVAGFGTEAARRVAAPGAWHIDSAD